MNFDGRRFVRLSLLVQPGGTLSCMMIIKMLMVMKMLMIMLTMTIKMVVTIKFMHDDFAMFIVEEEMLVYS